MAVQNTDSTKEATLVKEVTGEITKNVKETITREQLASALKAAQQSQSVAQNRLNTVMKDVAEAQANLDKYDLLVKSATK
jgi:chemotaxis regulatin CheY-phosphate phosphatase CheZ